MSDEYLKRLRERLMAMTDDEVEAYALESIRSDVVVDRWVSDVGASNETKE